MYCWSGYIISNAYLASQIPVPRLCEMLMLILYTFVLYFLDLSVHNMFLGGPKTMGNWFLSIWNKNMCWKAPKSYGES